MSDYVILEAPSILGLFPGGVERLPEALLGAGLAEALSAQHGGVVEPPSYEERRDPPTGIRNAAALRQYAYQLADATGAVIDAGYTPVVLGGDCSILLGNLLALSRRGRYGLLFIDGHADFYQPAVEPNGEAASMDLALATGRGPRVVTAFDDRPALIRDQDVVHVGRRDADEADQAGSQRIEDTDITVLDLITVRRRGAGPVTTEVLDQLVRPDLDGIWIHLDCDALDDAVMPAVDYRLPDGLSWDELETVLAGAVATGAVVGIEITIFNPALDADGSITHALVASLSRALTRR
jgi:arginase